MKAMMTLLLILCWIGNAEAQVVQLKEARVTYSPEVNVVTNLGDVELLIKESYAGQFSENPIQFMQKNFDIHELLSTVDTEDYFDGIQVSFINSKGLLKATFDKEGNLVRTYQKFKNIPLPRDIREQVYNDYKGWSMTKNKYVASGKGDMIQKEKYRIRLKNGSKNKSIKIIPAVPAGGRVTSI